MVQIDLDKLIENMFKIDIQSNNKFTNKSEIGIIAIKSLLPDKEQLGNTIDYKRFKEELKLWQDYRASIDEEFDQIFEARDNSDYFQFEDKYLTYRILPIIVGNTDYNIIEREVIKNILFTTGSLKQLWIWIFNTRFIYCVLNKNRDILEDIKDYIINFSQVDYLKGYKELYRFNIRDCKPPFEVEFERERINLLNILNGIKTKGYDEVEDLLNLGKNVEMKTDLGKIIAASNISNYLDVDLPKFFIDLNNYLLNLRKSRINPKDLKIETYKLPDVFSYKEGDIFFHSLLKDSKVIKKEVRNNTLTSLIQTKSGMYLFKRDSI